MAAMTLYSVIITCTCILYIAFLLSIKRAMYMYMLCTCIHVSVINDMVRDGVDIKGWG